MNKIILIICALGMCYISQAQFFPQTAAEADSIYQINIKKSRINKVYIPKSLAEALNELKALSDDAALTKFKLGSEDEVARGLHFGLGRWIRYNWNLEDGSRLGHLMREKYKIYSAEDQSDALIRLLHRDLNNKPQDLPGLAEMYEKKWNTVKQEQVENGEVLDVIKEEKLDAE
jgi:hypothetical protein